eukprot:m.1109615 g.1109615  ORF g.1109615 m.1109615 type:complete len:215 (-) comp24353_c0_seq22:268-912(-)
MPFCTVPVDGMPNFQHRSHPHAHRVDRSNDTGQRHMRPVRPLRVQLRVQSAVHQRRHGHHPVHNTCAASPTPPNGTCLQYIHCGSSVTCGLRFIDGATVTVLCSSHAPTHVPLQSTTDTPTHSPSNEPTDSSTTQTPTQPPVDAPTLQHSDPSTVSTATQTPSQSRTQSRTTLPSDSSLTEHTSSSTSTTTTTPRHRRATPMPTHVPTTAPTTR